VAWGSKTNSTLVSPSDPKKVCLYGFHVYYDENIDLLFVRKNAGRVFEHNDHIPLPVEYTVNSVNNIPQPTLKTVVGLIEGYASTSIVNLVLHIQGEKKLSPDSLKQLRKTVLNRKHMKCAAESSANCLLRLLESTPGLRYFVLTGSYDQAMQLVRVHKRYHVTKITDNEPDGTADDPSPGSDSATRRGSPNSTANTPVNEITYEAASTSDEHLYVESVVKALTLDDGEVLIAVFWATKEGILGHRRFPEIFGVDITNDTNNEKRPHIRVICKSRRNRNLPTIDGLLPSQQTYVFTIFFSEVVPFLLDKAALANTELVLSDQCPIMVPPLSHTMNYSVFGGGKHRLCKWHKVRDLILNFLRSNFTE